MHESTFVLHKLSIIKKTIKLNNITWAPVSFFTSLLTFLCFIFVLFFVDRYPGLNYDFETNSGQAYPYFSFGASCSEVEIDCLTGDHQVLAAKSSDSLDTEK